MRLVIWKARDVVAMDTLEDMNDLYVRCWVEGCAPQDTDVHWRAKKGKGSFNWRMKFDVALGHSTKAMKFPYLHVQVEHDRTRSTDRSKSIEIDRNRVDRSN